MRTSSLFSCLLSTSMVFMLPYLLGIDCISIIYASVQDGEEFNTCDALLNSQKLQNLEMTRTSVDPSTLLTTPNTPKIVEQTQAVKTHRDKWGNDDNVTVWSSGEDLNDEGNPSMHLKCSYLYYIGVFFCSQLTMNFNLKGDLCLSVWLH